VAPPAGFLAKRRVHSVGAARRADWTLTPNRGTRETTGSVRRSAEAVTEGPEVQHSGPSPCSSAAVSLRDRPPPNEETVDADASVDAQNAPTRCLQNRTARGFAQRPQPSSFS
jgi:hypothetical protein